MKNTTIPTWKQTIKTRFETLISEFNKIDEIEFYFPLIGAGSDKKAHLSVNKKTIEVLKPMDMVRVRVILTQLGVIKCVREYTTWDNSGTINEYKLA
jgi:hypothetical protein